MMSGAGRRRDRPDASAIPFASGSPISSSTRSIGVSARDSLGRRAHRIAGGVCDGRHRKALQTTEICPMRLGDQRLVLDDQHADHDFTVTVTTDPYVTSAVSAPLWRFTTWATSASPRPCCSASEPDFVE